jgi:hypothetical protein
VDLTQLPEWKLKLRFLRMAAGKGGLETVGAFTELVMNAFTKLGTDKDGFLSVVATNSLMDIKQFVKDHAHLKAYQNQAWAATRCDTMRSNAIHYAVWCAL